MTLEPLNDPPTTRESAERDTYTSERSRLLRAQSGWPESMSLGSNGYPATMWLRADLAATTEAAAREIARRIDYEIEDAEDLASMVHAIQEPAPVRRVHHDGKSPTYEQAKRSTPVGSDVGLYWQWWP